MYYSLLSRFQGALLGAALGENLGLYYEAQQRQTTTGSPRPMSFTEKVDLQCWQPGSSQPSLPTDLGRITVGYLKELLQRGRWDESAVIDVATAAVDRPVRPAAQTPQGSLLALTALPFMLFWHDNATKLRSVLSILSPHWKCHPGAETTALILGTAIAQALKNQLHPNQLIDQWLIDQWRTNNRAPGSPLHLESVQTLLTKGSSLRTAVTTILAIPDGIAGERAIALALYCFLSTPNDFRLTLLRAAHSGYCPAVVCALAGALAGAYNGITAVPVAWSMTSNPKPELLPWGITSQTLRSLATQLLATWAGAYDGTTFGGTLPAIAAPKVIRPR